MIGACLLVAAVVVVLAIVLEGKRQARVLGYKATGRPNTLGSALLEVQGLLEPERKVELMQEALRNPSRVEIEHDQEADDRP